MAFNVAYCRSSIRNKDAIMAKFYGLIYILFRFVPQRRTNSRTKDCRSAKVKEKLFNKYCMQCMNIEIIFRAEYQWFTIRMLVHFEMEEIKQPVIDDINENELIIREGIRKSKIILKVFFSYSHILRNLSEYII